MDPEVLALIATESTAAVVITAVGTESLLIVALFSALLVLAAVDLVRVVAERGGGDGGVGDVGGSVGGEPSSQLFGRVHVREAKILGVFD